MYDNFIQPFYSCFLRVKVGDLGAGPSTSSESSAQDQTVRRVTRMCIMMATTFTVAWVPFQATQLVLAYGNMEHALTILDYMETLTFINSCVNPIIYSLMWRPFRQSLIEVITLFG